MQVSGLLTCHVLVLVQGDEGLVVAVHEGDGLHVGSVVVPHLRQLQLHRHLHSQTQQPQRSEQE